jgi:hypothetical protein
LSDNPCGNNFRRILHRRSAPPPRCTWDCSSPFSCRLVYLFPHLFLWIGSSIFLVSLYRLRDLPGRCNGNYGDISVVGNVFLKCLFFLYFLFSLNWSTVLWVSLFYLFVIFLHSPFWWNCISRSHTLVTI